MGRRRNPTRRLAAASSDSVPLLEHARGQHGGQRLRVAVVARATDIAADGEGVAGRGRATDLHAPAIDIDVAARRIAHRRQ